MVKNYLVVRLTKPKDYNYNLSKKDYNLYKRRTYFALQGIFHSNEKIMMIGELNFKETINYLFS